ncbi:hypothetical protein CC80DRAFT_496208 [Byssothecium circinans]|uniref:Uncharacterized protein n=1 Tax=Byssothecium circinans TaxID=147558 RepID=A0A6A5TEX9_9PLEO|nr:hypothetical protein CC80DRAFT_496208 [Byssothecium circinans]
MANNAAQPAPPDSKAAVPVPVPVPADTHNLDNLQAMMNMVLISSGSYIKAHQAGQNLTNAQSNLKRSVNVASERFHDSLDELEIQILQAQTVLRRDLALMRADRKKREAAAKEKEAERARLAAESTAKKSAPVIQKVEPLKPTTPVLVKTEPPVKRSTSPAPPPEPAAPTQKVEDVPPPIASVAPVPEDAPVQNADTDMAPQDTEFDFDALFGESMDTSGGDGDQGELNLDDNHGDLNLDASGPDLNFTLDDSGPSLLRGLEDFAAKSSDDGAAQNTSTNMDLDFPMSNLPDATGNSATDQSDAKPQENPTNQQTADNTDLNLDAMMTDNLDDLFDMEYSNPEATQFDDAFFGFGD